MAACAQRQPAACAARPLATPRPPPHGRARLPPRAAGPATLAAAPAPAPAARCSCSCSDAPGPRWPAAAAAIAAPAPRRRDAPGGGAAPTSGSGASSSSGSSDGSGSGGAAAAQRRRVIAASGAAGGMGGHGGGRGEPVDSLPKRLLLGVAIAYIALVVLLPFINVFIQAFHKGIGPFLEHVLDPDFAHATRMTLLLAAVSVPLNTVFGTVAAILITRNQFPGKVFLLSLLDMPFSISPVVTGLMLTLLYGRSGWFAQFLAEHGFSLVFAFPGMALATMFVTMPFVVRELIPTLEQMDPSQEEAARTLGANPLQVFWHVTLPNIRWGLMYGVILTNARAMGEFGAVSVISGNIIGKTQTLTLFVESAYKEYNSEAAFAAAVLLSVLALMTLWVKDRVEQAAAAEAAK
ncbi:sulfate ABC transporter permease subunit [Raphidocelis subcapitata]|uniref:Sulfate ABC transporter permease subunit n=1 Tax=Raphidocelis subcapitata TaxID=307507 RepID=A0A2V0NX85_9CHLO|nr:sulfate ABC transporter permease subunit [Raphidocelis subcapitata]|eukprot:GBF92244.1 sulfate ABC transporter permease subunit [Raphidocelis subcapitata]